MRAPTAAYETEKNKKTGAKPVWILKIPFAAGTVYLSDRVFDVTGWTSPTPTILPWIAAWGKIDEDIAGGLAQPIVSDFDAEIIIDPDAADDIHDLLWSETVETLKCELFLWFEGLDASTDPPILIWVGNIVDFERISELIYGVSLVDEGVRIDKHPGRVLSLADYANASLDDVGFQMPIVYGEVEKVPALRLDVAKKTSLIAAITAAATDFYLTDGTGIANGADILIDGEQIHITTITTNHITACTRGYNSTTAAVHSAGALVLEKQTTCVFLFADHPVKAIDNIYALRADGVPVDITSVCTKYTGQTGSELAGYSGMAVVTCPGYVTFAKAVALGLTVDEGSHAHDGNEQIIVWDFDTYTIDNAVTDPQNSIDKNFSTKAVFGAYGKIYPLRAKYQEYDGAPTYFRACMTCGTVSGGMQFVYGGAICNGAQNSTTKSAWTAVPAGLDTWAEINAYTAGYSTGSTGNEVFELWVEFKYTPGINAGPASGVDVTLTGNEITDVAVGDQLLISGDGYQDDGSGTITGTPAALIRYPTHVMKHLLYTYAAWPLSSFSSDAGGPLSAKGYFFSAVLRERRTLRDWLNYMALQCRCWFRFAGGMAYLLYRPDSLVSDKTITAAMTRMETDYATTVRLTRSPLDEVINLVHLYYQRDWTKPAGREAYNAVTKATDATSVAAYGEKETADLFLFDFVRVAAMAEDLRDFYLARYKNRKKIVSATVFMDNMELEYADAVTFDALGSLLCEVQKVGMMPGNKETNDRIALTAREY
jgi:hypothetical protein